MANLLSSRPILTTRMGRCFGPATFTKVTSGSFQATPRPPPRAPAPLRSAAPARLRALSVKNSSADIGVERGDLFLHFV